MKIMQRRKLQQQKSNRILDPAAMKCIVLFHAFSFICPPINYCVCILLCCVVQFVFFYPASSSIKAMRLVINRGIRKQFCALYSVYKCAVSLVWHFQANYSSKIDSNFSWYHCCKRNLSTGENMDICSTRKL